jgi:uncharacterized protein (DUF4213/DUF364 family)
MQILNDLISTLDVDAPVKTIRLGIFHTAVVTNACGLAATLPKDALRQEPPMVTEPGLLTEKTALELARMAHSPRILEAAIGMATINSLLQVEADACIEQNAAELIAEKGAGKTVTVVGHFPFLKKIERHAARLSVIEKNPRGDDFGEEKAAELIPEADVVAITGTALTNHTMDGLLSLCSPGAYVIALGDTAPLSPVMFDHGLSAVCGTRVDDIERVLRCVSEGANFRQIEGVRRLTLLR